MMIAFLNIDIYMLILQKLFFAKGECSMQFDVTVEMD